MNNHVRRLIESVLTDYTGELSKEEIAKQVLATFNLEGMQSNAYEALRKRALDDVGLYLEERAVLAEGGPLRLRHHGAKTINVPPARPPVTAEGAPLPPPEDHPWYRDSRSERSSMMAYVPAEDLQPIRRFIERRANEVDDCPPVRPAETLRQLLGELEEEHLL